MESGDLVAGEGLEFVAEGGGWTELGVDGCAVVVGMFLGKELCDHTFLSGIEDAKFFDGDNLSCCEVLKDGFEKSVDGGMGCSFGDTLVLGDLANNFFDVGLGGGTEI